MEAVGNGSSQDDVLDRVARDQGGECSGGGSGGVDLASLRTMGLVVYGLYAASMLLGITVIVGVVIAYLKRGDAAGTFVESHFTNAIRTFWISMGLAIAGIVLAFVGVGYLILIGVAVWSIYRIAKGSLRLIENKPYA